MKWLIVTNNLLEVVYCNWSYVVQNIENIFYYVLSHTIFEKIFTTFQLKIQEYVTSNTLALLHSISIFCLEMCQPQSEVNLLSKTLTWKLCEGILYQQSSKKSQCVHTGAHHLPLSYAKPIFISLIILKYSVNLLLKRDKNESNNNNHN